MAKACDRCEKPVRTVHVTLKIKGVWKRWIADIDRAIQRRREGHEHPDYDLMRMTGKMELCEDCYESLGKWMSECGEGEI